MDCQKLVGISWWKWHISKAPFLFWSYFHSCLLFFKLLFIFETAVLQCICKSERGKWTRGIFHFSSIINYVISQIGVESFTSGWLCNWYLSKYSQTQSMVSKIVEKAIISFFFSLLFLFVHFKSLTKAHFLMARCPKLYL